MTHVLRSKKELLTDILSELVTLNKRIQRMSQEFDDLKAAVAKVTSVDQSAVLLLQGLKAKIDELVANGTVSPADLAALSASLGADTQGLADAVSANTLPPAPAPEPAA